MKRRILFLAVFIGLLPAMWLARGAATQLTPPQSDPAPAAEAAHFVPVDIYVDAGTHHLAAYQLEVTAKNAALVGVEGGTSKAFANATYDPAALQGNRIIVAAYSTDNNTLPTGDTRVARLHFLATGNPDPTTNLPPMTSKLVVATDETGKTIDAKLTLRPYQGDKP